MLACRYIKMCIESNSQGLSNLVLFVLSFLRTQPGHTETTHLFFGGLRVIIDLPKECPAGVLERPRLHGGLGQGQRLGRFVCRSFARRGRTPRGHP